MSYAPQSSSNSNGTLVLVTLGVCALSLLELVLVVVGYVFIVGSMFFSRVTSDYQRNDAARAYQQAREFAERQQELQRQMERNRQNAARWNPPTSTPSIPQPPANRTTTQSGPGTPYPGLTLVGINDRVHILWGGTWYPGTVIQKTATHAKVHYDNYSDAFDELVTVDRLRKMSPSDSKYRQDSPTAQKTGPTFSPPKAIDPADTVNAPFNSRFPAQDTVTRTWRDRNGNVIFRGRLYGNFGAGVRLINEQPGAGSYQSSPFAFANLSAEDQAYVKRFPELSPDTVMSAGDNDPPPRRSVPQPMPTPSPVEPPKPAPAETDPLKTMRTWTDSTGQHKLEAVFLRVENGQVQLQRKDGKITTMPLERLSAPDRELIRAKHPGS